MKVELSVIDTGKVSCFASYECLGANETCDPGHQSKLLEGRIYDDIVQCSS